MSYLIDTNVLSELKKKDPSPLVKEWLLNKNSGTLFLSCLTIGEIRKGVERLPNSEKKQKLSDWLEVDLPQFFTGRILPVDNEVADHWGHLMAKVNRPLPTIDSLLAATAQAHRLTLVTRNTKDLSETGVDLFNPWEGSFD